ncbi:DUF2590 family protein [Endozoicomonas sp. SCSIO W0465]|uniref:DUF2590 family protein n=1 Tax=Endozoicomonas sp. SCSIO W0465 TaxID=2918516 RepID=UPI00207613F7|nr:DUF2590 family protein [Endozoicomonas sp. SCSIO W0465]USE39125.1 DUF2590 family protein [Endozoicomonas sp. SCSIO W0465]
MIGSIRQYKDILITHRDITLDPAGIPDYVIQRPSITQDIVHMILESGLLIELVGERSRGKWTGNMTRIEMLVEDDQRIIPGTVVIDWDDPEQILLFAQSVVGEVVVTLSVPGNPEVLA